MCTLNLGVAARPPAPICPTRQRLAHSFARLQSIQRKRDQLENALFGRSSEDQIVWRELLELELQAKEEA